VFGFSLSAVLFLVIFLASLKSVRYSLRQYKRWVWLAVWITLGVLTSFFFNGIASGGTKDEGASIAVHYVYWLFLFVVTFSLLAKNVVSIKRMVEVIGFSTFILALLRLFELATYGKIGAWTGTVFFTQNTYGFLFSMFFPANYYLLLEKKGRHKLLAIARILIILLAVLVNGSRSSWIAVGASFVVFLGLSALSTHSFRLAGTVTFLVLALAGGYWAFRNFMPMNVVVAFENRLNTLDSLDTDKSYGVRQLEIQKGLILFADSPIFGIGPGRFTREFRFLDIPDSMAYGSQQHFNVKSAHNSYICFLAEEGLFASLPFALLVLSITIAGAFSCIRLLRAGQFWALGVYACFISMSVHMWAINSLTNTANWFVYALNVAMIVKASSISHQSHGTSSRLSLSRSR